MIMDQLLVLADSQTDTGSAASTDIIDLADYGDGNMSNWFVFRVNTAFTQTGSNTVTIQVQTATSTSWTSSSSSPATLVASAAIDVSSLSTGYIWKVRIPPGCKRYLRGYKVVSPNTGANHVDSADYDMFIVKDADIEQIYA